MSHPQGKDTQNMLAFSQQRLLATGVSDVVISSDNHGIADVVKKAGPLGGLYSVLQHQPCRAVLMLPVDLPLISVEMLKTLRQEGEFYRSACYFEGHSLPLYLPIDENIMTFLHSSFVQFNGKGPAIKQLLQQIPHKQIAVDESIRLSNTNTPEQWQHAQQLLQSGI